MKILAISLLLFLGFGVQSTWAEPLGPKAAGHALLGASTGLLIGASAGLCAYGESKNREWEPIVADALYGCAGGALLGTGGVLVSQDLPKTVYGYTAAGAGMGAACGAIFGGFVWALSIPGGADENNFYQGSTGMGIGALVGGALGLGAALVEFNNRPSPGAGDVSLRLELTPGLHRTAAKPGAPARTVMAMKMLEINF